VHANKVASSPTGGDASQERSPTTELQMMAKRPRNATTFGTPSEATTHFGCQIQEQDWPFTQGQGSLSSHPGSVIHGGHIPANPFDARINTEPEAPNHIIIYVTDIKTVNTRECLQCPANPYLAGNAKCPVTFRDYESMRIYVQQDHTHLEPQPAICIFSLTNVPTSDACKESGCAWFFVDDISDDTTIADWYPGMNKRTEDTRPNPLPFPCPTTPYLDPEHQCPARFANVDDMRAHGRGFHKILPQHDPVCTCALQQHARFPPCRVVGCAWYFSLLEQTKIAHIDWRPGHNYEPTQYYNQTRLPWWISLVWDFIHVRRYSGAAPEWWYKASNFGLLSYMNESSRLSVEDAPGRPV
jgi:hypothetical protein